MMKYITSSFTNFNIRFEAVSLNILKNCIPSLVYSNFIYFDKS